MGETERAYDNLAVTKMQLAKRILMVIVLLLSVFINQRAFGQTNIYKDGTDNFTFRYPTTWKQVEPQLETTRVLLYAQDDSKGTCNLSVIAKDRNSVFDYGSDFWDFVASQTFPGNTRVKSVEIVQIRERYFSISHVDFLLRLPSHSKLAESVSAVTVERGKRYMIICNGIRGNFKNVENTFDMIVGTLIFVN